MLKRITALFSFICGAMKKLAIIGILAVPLGCSFTTENELESEVSVKLDIAVNEIRFMQREIEELNQKLNVIQAGLTLPDNILPTRGGVSEFPISSYTFDLTQSHFQGHSLAHVAIVEFADYECPFCKQHFGTTYQQIKNQYVDTGMVRYYIVDFPLDSHAFAFQAAVAAHCAGQQDQFWNYHDRLFAIQNPLYNDSFDNIAESLNLDMAVFGACRSDSSIQTHIESQMAQAVEIGVSGTPTFLIGKIDDQGQLTDGVILRGARPLSSFRDLIAILRI